MKKSSKKNKQKNQQKNVGFTILFFLGIIFIIWSIIPSRGKNVSKEADAHAKELSSLVNISLLDGLNKIEEYEFTPNYTNARNNTDVTDVINTTSDKEKEAYTITQILASSYSKTANVFIATEADLQAMKMAKNLEQQLDPAHAWQAVESFGQSQYPYGFELHYIVSKLAQEASDENTWFLKATCDVTNELGEKQELTCESYVSGTTESPEIIDFIVY